MVPLVRVLDLSPESRSTLGAMLRWLGLFLLSRASSQFLPILCLFLSSPSAARLVLFKIRFGQRLVNCVTYVQPLVAQKKGKVVLLKQLMQL